MANQGGESTGSGAGGVVSGAFNSTSAKIKDTPPETLAKCIRGFNVVNAIILIVSGVISFTLISDCKDTSDCTSSSYAVLGFYMILFAVLLLLFEMRVQRTDGWIRANCGFMYSNRGKALLILFLATLCFSITDKDLGGNWWVPLLIGLISLVNGIFLCFTVYIHPSFDDYTKAHDNERHNGISYSGETTTSSTTQGAAPSSSYRFGDAHADSASYTSYDLRENTQQQHTSTPFANNNNHQTENPFSNDNPFQQV